MHILDIIFGIFLLLFLLNGIRKGLVSSLIHLLGLVIAVVLIGKIGHLVKASLIAKLGFSEVLAVVAAYILIFLIIMIITKIAIMLATRIVQLLSLMWLNRLLGAVFSLLCGVIIISILIILANLLPFEKEISDFTRDSYIISTIRGVTEKLESRYSQIEKVKKPIKSKIDETIDEKNKQLQEIMN